MDEQILVSALQNKIKERVSDFQIKFKDESILMKLIGKIIKPFNSSFMTDYITTLGKTIYFPSKDVYESWIGGGLLLEIISHEYVHIMDYVQHPIKFSFKYLFPQLFSSPSILFLLLLPVWLPLMIFSIISPWLLFIITSILFLAPIPSYGRRDLEIRGYSMSCKVPMWRYGSISDASINFYVEQFTGPSYYYMWPFKKQVEEKLNEYIKADNSKLFDDENPAWLDVYNVLKDNGALH